MDKKQQTVEHWAAIALETTGLAAADDYRGLEVAIVLMRAVQTPAECRWRIKPGPCIWERRASQVNGIWSEDINDSQRSATAWCSVVAQSDGCQARVAHNVPFIAAFVADECRRLLLNCRLHGAATCLALMMVSVGPGCRTSTDGSRGRNCRLCVQQSTMRVVAEIASNLWGDLT